jgi:hypothetical protein
VRLQGVRRAEGQHVVEVGLPGGAVGFLLRQRQAGHREVGTLVLGPPHGSVLDRHLLQVGAELDAEVELGRGVAEELDHGLAEAVRVAAEVQRPVAERVQFPRGGEDTDLGDVVAVPERRLAVVAVGQRVPRRVAEEFEICHVGAADRLDRGLGGPGGGGHGLLHRFRHRRARFQRPHGEQERRGIRLGEHGAGGQNEILGVGAFVSGELRPLGA